MFNFITAFVSTYSLLAIALVVAFLVLKFMYGVRGVNQIINFLAGSRNTLAIEIFSYSSLAAWFALVLPWMDLLTVQWFTRFQDDGMVSYFGQMKGRDVDIYFVVMFFNILGAKAAMTLAELARMLRKGRVLLIPRGPLWVFMSEPKR